MIEQFKMYTSQYYIKVVLQIKHNVYTIDFEIGSDFRIWIVYTDNMHRVYHT